MPRIWILVGLALLVLVACGSWQSDKSAQNSETSQSAVEQAYDTAGEIESLKQEIRLLEAQVAVLVKFVTDMESDLSELEQGFLCYHESTSC
ncbi:MAG: hypothetical protein O2913_10875 [Chloroflexi bacterium]|nr:hypothetical protein [Chloroflexota bacterium]